MDHYSTSQNFNVRIITYELYGIIIHSGHTANAGHYTSNL